MSVLKDFKDFISRGNVIDMAVGIVIGTAFTALVTAFVVDMVTPLIGVAGHYDFSKLSYRLRGSTFLYGAFLNQVLSFALIALVVYFLIVRPIAQMEARQKARHPAPAAPVLTRECPECLSAIPRKAKRCSACTAIVAPVE